MMNTMPEMPMIEQLKAIRTATADAVDTFQQRVAVEDFIMTDELKNAVLDKVMEALKYRYAVDHDLPDDSPALPRSIIDDAGLDDEVADYANDLYDIMMPDMDDTEHVPTPETYEMIRNLINGVLSDYVEGNDGFYDWLYAWLG